MKEIMVAYWSGTGNTAAMATILGKGIQDGGATAKVVSVEDIKADDLKDYPVFALGCPSMGNETLVCNHFYIVSKADWILLSLMNCLLFYYYKGCKNFFLYFSFAVR